MIQNRDQASDIYLQSVCPSIKDLVNIKLIQRRIGAAFYEQMCIQLLEISEEMQAHKNTKFLARHILDLALTNLTELSETEKTKVGMVCLMLAFRINQTEDLPNKMEFEEVFQFWKNNFGLKELLGKVEAIVEEGSKRNQKTLAHSPYDFVAKAISAFQIPVNISSSVKEGMDNMIDLAISHPELGNYSCQEIFEASWITFLEVKMTEWATSSGLLPAEELSEKTNQMKTFLVELIEDEE